MSARHEITGGTPGADGPRLQSDPAPKGVNGVPRGGQAAPMDCSRTEARYIRAAEAPAWERAGWEVQPLRGHHGRNGYALAVREAAE